MNAPPNSQRPQKPRPQPNTLAGSPEAPQSLPDKAAQAQADYLKWSALAAQPGLNPQEAEWARGIARSSQAAARLGRKALAYQEPTEQDDLSKVIGNTPSPAGQPTNTDQPNPRS